MLFEPCAYYISVLKAESKSAGLRIVGVECLCLLFVSEYSAVVRKGLMSVWFISVFVVEAFKSFQRCVGLMQKLEFSSICF